VKLRTGERGQLVRWASIWAQFIQAKGTVPRLPDKAEEQMVARELRKVSKELEAH
jgi:hypothetical protein